MSIVLDKKFLEYREVSIVKIQTSAEDYLEAILMISKNKNSVRAADIVKHTGYARASISIALSQLKDSGHIAVDENRNITLTEKGTKIATHTYERHLLIENFLVAIGVDKETAFADACKLEHGMSKSSFECLSEYYKQNFSSKQSESSC